MDYCDYYNEEWRKRFDRLKSKHYKTKMDGNTLYVIRRKPILIRIFYKIILMREPLAETINMVKLKESTLIKCLKKYEFNVKGVDLD